MKPDKNKNLTLKEKIVVWFGILVLAAFVISAIASVVVCVITLSYHVRNPQLTIMQVWIWNLHRYWGWYIAAVASYLLLIVVRKNLK